MRLLEVHTVPVWQECDGALTLGLAPRDPHPPVVGGWCNVAHIRIDGATRRFLLTMEDR